MIAIHYASAMHFVFLKDHLMRLAKPFQLKENTLEFSQLLKKAHEHKVQGLKKQNTYKNDAAHLLYLRVYSNFYSPDELWTSFPIN